MIKRKLFYPERFLHLNNKKSARPISLVLSGAIKGDIPEERVKKALVNLQKKHPALRASIEGKYITYEDTPTTPVPLRIAERISETTWIEEKDKEIAFSQNSEEPLPLVKFVWVKSPKISDFILIGLHVVMDGKSLCHLMREFVLQIDDPEKELKPYKPIESLQEILPDVSLNWKEKLIAICWTEITRTRLFFATFAKKERPSAHSYSCNLYIKKEMASLLEENAKKRKTMLGNVLCILALKLFKAHLHPEKSQRNIFLPMDIRRYIPAIKKDMMFGFAPMLRLKIDISEDTDPWEASVLLGQQIVNEAITRQEANKNSISSYTKGLFFLEYYHRIINLLLKRNYTLDEGQDFTFLNMGSFPPIPMKNSPFEVDKFHSAEVYLPWLNSTVFGCGSYDSNLFIIFISDKNFIPEEKMKTIRSEFEAALSELVKE